MLIQLALMNHGFTSLSGKTLLRAAERDGWRVTPRLKKLLEIMADHSVEMRSAIVVLAEFLYRVLGSGAPRKARGRIFAAGLEAFEKHDGDAVREIHSLLGRIAERTFAGKSYIHARRRREWKEHIDAWLARFRRGQKSVNG